MDKQAPSAATFFAKRIRDLREARGWSQERTAELCGVGYKLYQLYELGIKRNPGLETIEFGKCTGNESASKNASNF